jgi:Zn finger protein HypA/HybF involved in hydrogenase expression
MTTNHPVCADCNAPFDLNYSATDCPVCGGFAAGARRDRPMSVVRKGTTITFTSNLTDNEAAVACERMTWSNFARDLAAKYETHKGLSPKQLAWLHFLAVEQAKRDAAPKPAPQVFPGIYDLLHRMADAGGAKKRSRVTVYWRGLRLSIGSEQSKNPGSITITSDERAYEDRTWHGRILESGEMQTRRSGAPEAVITALRELSADPTEQTLAREGRVSGVCCRCNAELTKDESKTLGYGPTCAKYLGLKHGKRAAAAVVAEREAARLELVTEEAA